MTEPEPTDAVLQHVAVLAFLHYPGIEVDDPTYSLSDDIEWCLARLADVDDIGREHLRVLIRRAITDPTGNRELLFTTLCERGVVALDHHE